jgi:hypothetical protein
MVIIFYSARYAIEDNNACANCKVLLPPVAAAQAGVIQHSKIAVKKLVHGLQYRYWKLNNHEESE